MAGKRSGFTCCLRTKDVLVESYATYKSPSTLKVTMSSVVKLFVFACECVSGV